MKNPVIVIVGPTASGKTEVAIKLAEKINGEIVAADSRTIFRGMDVGTAKPNIEDRNKVVHYGLDLVEPDERFTVYDWKCYAEKTISQIMAHGKNPIVVGGTGLYVDALIYNYQFGENKRSQTDRLKMKDNYLVYGIKWDTEQLKKRIERREQQMFNSHQLIDETQKLVEKYSWDLQSMRSNIYQYVWKMMKGELSKEEAIRLGVFDDLHLAKRQMTWFKRNPEIKWCKMDEIILVILDDLKKIVQK